jgi:hypothetical protein
VSKLSEFDRFYYPEFTSKQKEIIEEMRIKCSDLLKFVEKHNGSSRYMNLATIKLEEFEEKATKSIYSNDFLE